MGISLFFLSRFAIVFTFIEKFVIIQKILKSAREGVSKIMKERTLDDIALEIQNKREMMVKVANQFGFTHEKTIRFSQDLDILISEYQMYPFKTSRNNYYNLKKYSRKLFNRVLKIGIL